MDTLALLDRLTARGVVLEAHGDKLRWAPLEALTPEEVEELRTHKRELLEILRRRGWRVKDPARTPAQEAQDIEEAVARDGYCLTWCETVKDLVAWDPGEHRHLSHSRGGNDRLRAVIES